MHVQTRMSKMTQRGTSHLRTEVGTADADVDNVGDGLAAVSQPAAVAHAFNEAVHTVEDGMHVAVDILPINGKRAAARRAQGSVQHGTMFGKVDFFTVEHGIALGLYVTRPGQFEQ